MSDSCVTLWTVAPSMPLSMGFSRQEYWSGLPWLSPGDLPDPRTEPVSTELAGGFFTTDHQGSSRKQLPCIYCWKTSPVLFSNVGYLHTIFSLSHWHTHNARTHIITLSFKEKEIKRWRFHTEGGSRAYNLMFHRIELFLRPLIVL